MKALARHLILELKDCDRDLLNDSETLKTILLGAARAAGATILGESFHRFQPQGVSGVVIIAESHLFIHTWPECGSAAVDVFTCGDNVDPEKAVWKLLSGLKVKNHSIMELQRGILDTR